MEKIVFEARNVSGKRGLFRGFQLQNVDFQLPYGYIMGIIGKNGAGKSTFFDYIMNERKRYQGELLLEGVEIHSDYVNTMDKIGFISEKNEFPEMHTPRQIANLFGRFYTQFDKEVFEQTMNTAQVSVRKVLDTMSRGERMKFQLAFAMAHKPKLYLLDEATAGMDPVFRMDFYKLLRLQMADQDCAVILSTHLEEEIEKQLDYIGLLEQGKFLSFEENKLV